MRPEILNAKDVCADGWRSGRRIPASVTEILSRLKTGACSIDLLQYYRRNELWDFVGYLC